MIGRGGFIIRRTRLCPRSGSTATSTNTAPKACIENRWLASPGFESTEASTGWPRRRTASKRSLEPVVQERRPAPCGRPPARRFLRSPWSSSHGAGVFSAAGCRETEPHPLDRQAESVGRDLRQRCPGSRPHIARRACDLGGAISEEAAIAEAGAKFIR
jgi:hypothetical protein